MRKINSQNFHVATRETSRGVNERIALNLLWEHQSLSRAALARIMGVQRSAVTLIVRDLLNKGLIYERGDSDGTPPTAARGRRPTLLRVKTSERLIVAVDIRFTGIYVMLCDFGGEEIALEHFETIFEPDKLVRRLARRINALLEKHGARASCEGIGLAAPGMVDHETGLILHAPMMGWRNVALRDDLARLTRLPVVIENTPKACALAQIWLADSQAANLSNFVYLMVSDGVGVGAVAGGVLLRGRNNAAGEFGHTPLNLDGPRCNCGLYGCWEIYTSNQATLSRYYGRPLPKNALSNPSTAAGEKIIGIGELIELARGGDAKAVTAIQTTARYLGIGLATVVAALDPERIFIGGEITAAWDLIENTVLTALEERSLSDQAAKTPVEVVSNFSYPRLRGAAALMVAPEFAAPRVA